jgi:hypothetical protein
LSVSQDALAPVRAALLSDAERDAARTLAAADADVAALRVRTAEECERLRREARARGEADAQEVVSAERARTHRQARALVQHARGDAFDELRRRVRLAAAALRDASDYPELRTHLEEQARTLVGDARLSEPADGGVVAEDGGRRAVLTLTGLADRVLDRLGPDLEGLWTP